MKRIPDNEFTHFCTGDMKDADEAYRKWLILRDKRKKEKQVTDITEPKIKKI